MLKKAGKMLAKNPGEGSSFRLIEKALVERILTHVQNFVFIDELLLWYTSDIGFVQVMHEKSHKKSQSSYSNRKLFGLAANIMIYYSSLPLRIMIWGGFLSSIVSFLFGMYFLVRKFMHMAMHGYTSIIVAILFSTSIIVFSIGILGEYLNRLYMVQNRKPSFHIKRILK
jgi:undecaprenyl-phosphate 4-deoxy-4-formamido-L-arabinose transferase